MKVFATKYGPWAVVTGASAGIGRSFADQIAAQGVNVVLVARNKGPLQETAHEIESRHGVQTRVVVLDLSDPSAPETLDMKTRDLDVGLLINNAAVEQRGAYVKHTPRELRDVIQINVTTPTELGQRYGQRLVRRGGGGIVYVSGSIGYQAVPYLANYAATKAHQVNLAEALYYELKPHGVDVLGLSPGLTRTPMVDRLQNAVRFGRIGMMQLQPGYVATIGLKKLGRRPSAVVGLQYQIFAALTKRVLSRASGAWLFGTLMRIAFADPKLIDSSLDAAETDRRPSSLRNAASN